VELGTLNGPTGQPITISGLSGLSFGAGNGKVGDANTLYFSANPQFGASGIFGSIAINPGTAPKIASVVAGDGTAQRSMVTQIQVAFDQHVVLPQDAAQAFRLNRQGDGAAVSLTADVDDLGAGTVVTLHFVGGAVEPSFLTNPSLADGVYTLTVRGAQIGGPNGPLDVNGDGVGDDLVVAGNVATNKLFRLFGDVNGDAVINALDLAAFRSAFGTISIGSLSPFDVNGDGVINLTDLTAFRNRFGVVLP
jgi:Dockerin type I domain